MLSRNNYSVTFKGIRFGLLLQLAIGPMCIMVFNAAATQGFIQGIILTVAISLIDALYIGLSFAGISTIIDQPKIKRLVKVFSSSILVLFGVNTLMSVFNLSLFPSISLFAVSNVNTRSLFFRGLLLTASNPLTIVFWSGALSNKLLENEWDKKQLSHFSIGCIASTLIFLTSISLLGSVLNTFLPTIIITTLNVLVGIILTLFGIKILLK